ncbi:MAG: ATP-binding protein [Planctomycetes bacterium]|nr:ATP-binding protein [Planctomycetota bacterium]
MATSEQVKALVRSHAERDDERFYAIAMQVAAQAARSGHGRFSQELRILVDEVRARQPALAAPPAPPLLVQPRGELAGLLAVVYPRTRLVEMVLEDRLRRRLERVLTEQRDRERLLEHGLPPTRKILLVGPPGTGKTMTASAIATELGLPLFTIQLDGLITKYLGETAAKLRLVFDAIRQTRAVYFFDEFDALGGERASKNDVGEIRRVLNSFLQFLEADSSDSLILAATNHMQLLDRALFRRFDSVVEFSLPTAEGAEQVMRAKTAFLNTTAIDWLLVRKAAEGLSHAEISRACEQAAKNAILRHSTTLTSDEIIESLTERKSASN